MPWHPGSQKKLTVPSSQLNNDMRIAFLRFDKHPPESIKFYWKDGITAAKQVLIQVQKKN